MRPEELLTRLGGCATWTAMTAAVSQEALQRAVASGEVVRLRRGRYALPMVEEHRREAHRRTAVLSHLSAAVAHGWPVKWPPKQPWITVPRKRKVAPADRRGVHVVYRDLSAEERATGLTSPLRTVLDCAMRLPFDEALAVADSALRAGDVSHAQLIAAARALRGPGGPAARAVSAAASPRAANPFESVLRALALQVPGLSFRPQVQIADRGLFATVDLADEAAGVVLEAEGFEFHGTRRALVRDCRRYTELAVYGWTVLRFTWEDVMLCPDWVLWALRALAAHRSGLPVPVPARRQERAVPA
jgi:very-short-patch-repair endonuclease